MTRPVLSTQTDADDVMAQVCAELSEKLRTGHEIDINIYVAQWPQFEDQLRQILPAIEAMQKFGAGQPDVRGRQESVFFAEPLGDFRIVREIGRGGMGVVYEAEQVSLGRRVALKVLPMAATMDQRQQSRFRNEAMAAAGLNHPNIVPVYAVGCDRGVHYYAMHYIRGQNLADLIAEVRFGENSEETNASSVCSTLAQASRTSANTYFESVARMIRDAANALAFAHEAGIIHRDIKPSNLLLDTDGKLWITDFGLARTTTSGGMTLTGDLLGTLRYMSPEQTKGKRMPIDHRTDIFSLGATLYELLTSQPMYSGADQAEILQQMNSEDRISPRRLCANIPVDLETITLKAASHIAADRYSSMRELADDLDRFLKGDLIRAQAIGPVTRLWRFVRQHSAVFSASFAVSLFVAIGMGVVFRLLVDPKAELPEGSIARPVIAEEERAFYEELQKIDTDNTEARNQLAQSRDRMANLQLDQMKYAESAENFRRAIAIYEQLTVAEPAVPQYSGSLCHAWMNYGRSALYLNDLEVAEQRFRNAIVQGERSLQLNPNEPEFRKALALPFGQLGIIHRIRGRLAEAESSHQREIALHSLNVGARPGDWGDRLVLGAAHAEFAKTLARFGDLSRAVDQWEKSIEANEWILRVHPELSINRNRMVIGLMARSSLRLIDGESLGSVFPDIERAIALSPEPAGVLDDAAWCVCRFPSATTNQVAVAREWALRSVMLHEIAKKWTTIGVAYYRSGNYDEALHAFAKSRSLAAAEGNGSYNSVQDAYNTIFESMTYKQLNQDEKAISTFDTATRLIKENARGVMALELYTIRAEVSELLGATP